MTYYVINNWNHLPTEVVTAPNLSTFKTKFDTFYKNIKSNPKTAQL